MIIMSCIFFLEEHSIDFSVTDVFNFWEVIGHLENLKKKTINPTSLGKFILSIPINVYI